VNVVLIKRSCDVVSLLFILHYSFFFLLLEGRHVACFGGDRGGGND
jgi:hypothetical protein